MKTNFERSGILFAAEQLARDLHILFVVINNKWGRLYQGYFCTRSIDKVLKIQIPNEIDDGGRVELNINSYISEQMKYNVSAYVIKIWLTSVVVAPIIITVLGMLLFQWHVPDIGVAVIMILLGGMCSLPSLGVLYIVGIWLSRSINQVVLMKTLLTIIGAALTYIPFLCVNNFNLRMNITTWFICMTYLLLIVFGIWLYKLQPVNDAFEIAENSA